jgi:predicted metal-dependent HD superfamily phosphohydrolase
LVLDCDMAILGESQRRFESYERQIRQEYRSVPEILYLTGRRNFLQGLLKRPIYHSTFFSSRLELQARQNIQRALKR